MPTWKTILNTCPVGDLYYYADRVNPKTHKFVRSIPTSVQRDARKEWCRRWELACNLVEQPEFRTSTVMGLVEAFWNAKHDSPREAEYGPPLVDALQDAGLDSGTETGKDVLYLLLNGWCYGMMASIQNPWCTPETPVGLSTSIVALAKETPN